jgi:hypothetical protein
MNKLSRTRMLDTQLPDFDVSVQTATTSPWASQIAFLFGRFFRNLANGAQKIITPVQVCHKLLTTLCDHRFRGLTTG